MKRIVILIFSLVLVVGAMAQTTKTKALSTNQWYYSDDSNYSLSTDGDSVLTYTFTLNKADDVLYDVQIALDSIGGTPNYVLDLKGKVFEDDDWSDIETDVEWTGTSADTTILFQEHSTAVYYRYIQLQVNGQASTGAAQVDKVELKIWK